VHIPSAWPITGIRDFCWICRTRALEPRGITRSMRVSSSRREETSARVEIDWIVLGGRDVDARAVAMREVKSVVEWRDSLPPFKIAVLPM
jgi:hypothetical protein